MIFTYNNNYNIIYLYDFPIKMYSLSYLLGFLFGYLFIKYLIKRDIVKLTNDNLVNFMFYSVIGIILGGRIGYILFYGFDYYSQNIIDIFKVWEGGMSFHGALLGLILSTFIYSKINKIDLINLFDLLAISSPIGILLGRIANFLNGELVGKPTGFEYGVIFSKHDDIPRHPSQLYEALFEGLIVFITLILLVKFINKIPGLITGVFLIEYSLFRYIIEYYREPDYQIGLVLNSFSMGQILSMIMFVIGLILITYSIRKIKL